MAVIEFEHVSKAYHLGASRTSLREAMVQLPRGLFSRNGAQPDDQLLWALNDVSFQVEQGEALGIIGPNGAGKSTILKLMSKVSFPTSGHIRTRGRMVALIELGAGFHPDLTGRENIYLNGAILGLKKQEIDAQFSNIVEYAELERFIDTPIKRYSSGMYVRLAFAVAAHVKAELLLIDEVLSVGDAAFQQKCLAKMNELRDGGATIVYISHNLWSVGAFCERALLLREGQMEAEGDPGEVIQIYREQDREALLVDSADAGISDDTEPGMRAQAGETVITKIELLNKKGQPEREFDAEEQMVVRVHYTVPKRIEAPVFVFRIKRSDGLICCALHNWTADSSVLPSIQGQGTFIVRIGPVQLVPDFYTVEVLITDGEQPVIYAESSSAIFRVKGHFVDQYGGVFKPDVEWLTEQSE
jgi:lipopolysaccharide transport system ATP-binding protein